MVFVGRVPNRKLILNGHVFIMHTRATITRAFTYPRDRTQSSISQYITTTYHINNALTFGYSDISIFISKSKFEKLQDAVHDIKIRAEDAKRETRRVNSRESCFRVAVLPLTGIKIVGK